MTAALVLALGLAAPAKVATPASSESVGSEPASSEPASYEELWQRVREDEAAGRYARAARRVERAHEQWPQDYWLVLHAGWMRLQAGHYTRARRHYEHAAEMSSGSVEARLGLSSALLYAGRREAALEVLRALAREHPQDPRVAAALETARARPRIVVSPHAAFIVHLYDDHPTLRQGLGATGGVSLRVVEHLAFSAAYGYARIGRSESATVSRGAGPGGGGGGSGGSGGGGGSGDMDGEGMMMMGDTGLEGDASPIDQHQLHASAGVVYPIAGALLQYGHLRGDQTAAVHVVGTSLRHSPWGDLVLDANLSVSEDAPLLQIVPSWRMPVSDHVWLRPALSLQVQESQVPLAGLLSVGLHGKPGEIWAGGMGGRRRRPADLSLPAIFNFNGDVRWGAWLAGALALPHRLALGLGYEVYGVDVPLEGSQSRAHYVSVGLRWRSS